MITLRGQNGAIGGREPGPFNPGAINLERFGRSARRGAVAAGDRAEDGPSRSAPPGAAGCGWQRRR